MKCHKSLTYAAAAAEPEVRVFGATALLQPLNLHAVVEDAPLATCRSNTHFISIHDVCTRAETVAV
jgi:hypothetical protein